MKISRDQATTIAAFVRPRVKEYIEANRAEYEKWLKNEQNNPSNQTQRKTKSIGYKVGVAV